MGRVKLEIRKLESNNGRQVTYSKRKVGIIKKARELSILCDIDVILLLFSPSGKAALCLGEQSNIEDVVGRFAHLTPQERSKRKMESLEILKKTFVKLDHEINIQDFLGASPETIEVELTGQLGIMKARTSEISNKLSYWLGPEKINNDNEARGIQGSLNEALSQLQVDKRNFKKQLLPLHQTSQSYNSTNITLGLTADQQGHSWLPNQAGRQLMSNVDPQLVSGHREAECSSETHLPSFSAYLEAGKHVDMDHSSSDNALTQKNGNAKLNVQLEYCSNSYESYNQNHNFLGEKKSKDVKIMNAPSVDYQVPEFDPPETSYDNSVKNWASSSSNCTVPSSDEN